MRRIYFSKYGSGNFTNFVEKIGSGEKKHTIRKTPSKVGVGDFFQPSEWSGRSRGSKAVNLGEPLQVIYIADVKIAATTIWVNEIVVDKVLVAKNDGLSLNDFFNWFPSDFSGKMIGWTEFPY